MFINKTWIFFKMVLYLIGLGLADKKDISVKGLEIIRKCDLIYLENYTSLFQSTKEELEEFYGKKIILAPRELMEEGAGHIVEEAKDKDVAVLIIGDPFSATTHIEFIKNAFYMGVKIEIINNASILTAVGITGLQLYKFGKITSIPFNNPNLETPYEVVKMNKKNGLHSLLLLDLKPEQNRFMAIDEAIEILETIEKKKKENIICSDLLVVGCARLGSKDFLIKAGKLKEIKEFDFGKPLHCLIIPGELHFTEKDVLGLYH